MGDSRSPSWQAGRSGAHLDACFRESQDAEPRKFPEKLETVGRNAWNRSVFDCLRAPDVPPGLFSALQETCRQAGGAGRPNQPESERLAGGEDVVRVKKFPRSFSQN